MKNAIIAIAAIIILGGGAYFLINQGKNTPEMALDAGDENKQGGLTVKDSLFSWLKGGTGVECTVKAEDGEITVYTLGNKVRMDGVSMMPQEEEMGDGAFLSDSKFVYIWSGAEGIKMDLEKMQSMAGEQEAEQAEQYSWESIAQEWEKSEVDYDCREKKLDSAIFDVPDDVAFVDWTEMMEGIMEMGEKMQASMEDGGGMDIQAMREIMDEADMEEMEIPAE